jgi:LysR family transcriptional regulator, glycine cleavage system transcriptional activator
MMNRALGTTHGRNLRIETLDTTPLALMMVSQGLGLAIGHMPVCAPLAKALRLEICKVLPNTQGPGNYYLDYSPDRAPRSAVVRLAQAVQTAAQISAR